jgi:large subunit ribosomal protein L25
LESIELKAKIRTTKGDGPAKVMRREGLMPAVLYGPDTDPIMLSVSTHELELALKGGTSGQSLFALQVEGDEKSERSAMIKELQRHPLNNTFLHADFYEVAMDRKINVMVPVVTTGKCQGIEMGGMLQIIRREIEVLCYPNEIPESITVDITDLDIGDSLHVQDVPLKGNIEIPADVNFTILTISAIKVEEEVVEEEAEELEEGVEEDEAAEAGAETEGTTE